MLLKIIYGIWVGVAGLALAPATSCMCWWCCSDCLQARKCACAVSSLRCILSWPDACSQLLNLRGAWAEASLL